MTKREHLLEKHLEARSRQFHGRWHHHGEWRECLQTVCLTDNDLLFNPEFIKALSVRQ